MLPVISLTPIKEARIEDEDVSSFQKKKDKRILLTPVKKGKDNKIDNSQQTDKQDSKQRYGKRGLSLALMKDAKRRKQQQCTWKKALNSEGMYMLNAPLPYLSLFH